jgi:hypothetical protein
MNEHSCAFGLQLATGARHKLSVIGDGCVRAATCHSLVRGRQLDTTCFVDAAHANVIQLTRRCQPIL